MDYRLLSAYRSLFDGVQYRHRSSNRGDWVAMHLYEDLHAIGRSSTLKARVEARSRVVNRQNKARGIESRRGDGAFGELNLDAAISADPAFAVARGEIATIEIGIEVKVLAKAMIKQLDRVIGDMRKQVEEFKKGGNNPICVGLIGVNYAPQYTSYEGDRAWPTDGKAHRHPIQEAEQAEERLLRGVRDVFDGGVLSLRFRASNEPPYPFAWQDEAGLRKDYGALLIRLSNLYTQRFP